MNDYCFILPTLEYNMNMCTASNAFVMGGLVVKVVATFERFEAQVNTPSYFRMFDVCNYLTEDNAKVEEK